MGEPLPTPERVRASDLEALLRGAGVAGSGTIDRIEREPIGTGQMASNYRFRLHWRDPEPGAPRSLVGKFPSEDPTSRGTGASQGSYRREVCFYRQLAPGLHIRTPRCYGAALSDDGADFVLWLEDMTPATQGDQIAGCRPDEAARALEQLAGLHAPRWGDEGLAALDFLQGNEPGAGALLQTIYQSLWPGFEARYADRLDADALGLAERLGPRLRAWVDGATSPRTVTHGDFRLDNLLFGADGEVTTVDWQTVGRGVALADASYFLGAGLPLEQRRSEERRLIGEYHAALCEKGVEGYDFETCWQDYRRFAFSGVVMAVVASMIVGQTERGDAMFLAMASRHARHALDLEAESLLGA